MGITMNMIPDPLPKFNLNLPEVQMAVARIKLELATIARECPQIRRASSCKKRDPGRHRRWSRR